MSLPRSRLTRYLSVLLAFCFLMLAVEAGAQQRKKPLPGHGLPPKAKRSRMTGGESFPPLPLPATPLRRTERKREPSPPVLLVKLDYANDAANTVTDDAKTLLRWTNSKLGIRYRPARSTFAKFSYDPAEEPVLYLTGHKPLPELSDSIRGRLYRYLMDGGTMIANACCGDKAFANSFQREIRTLFPDRELFLLPSDHPVYSAFHKIESVKYQRGRSDKKTAPPYLEGINIGCRTAVFFAPIDLANGWYGQNPPVDFAEGQWIVGKDARSIGSNIITYVLANYQLGRFFATQRVLHQRTEPTRDQFVLAQVMHNGDWDPNPSAIPGLLKFVQANSTLSVKFKREQVSIGDADVFLHPVLYMTGHRDWTLSEQEVARLRAYLNAGGMLVADACCGRATFDIAFRRELKRVLPDSSLDMLPAGHPLYSTVFPIQQVDYSPLVQHEQPGLNRPALEGVTRDGQLQVIYSQFALGNGWEQFPHPYNRGYADRDALRLGTNIFVYAMTH